MMSRTHTGSGNELMVLLVNGKIKKGIEHKKEEKS